MRHDDYANRVEDRTTSQEVLSVSIGVAVMLFMAASLYFVNCGHDLTDWHRLAALESRVTALEQR